MEHHVSAHVFTANGRWFIGIASTGDIDVEIYEFESEDVARKALKALQECVEKFLGEMA